MSDIIPVVDPEFQALIPPLSPEELQQLEANIVAKGCRIPLVVWKGLLLDGHHRKAICEKHQLPYRTVEEHCEDRDDAKIWIVYNQLGRRNLAPFQRVELFETIRPIIEARAKASYEANVGRPAKSYQNSDTIPESVHTLKELAKRSGLSHDTHHRGRVILREGSEDLKAAIRQKKISLNQAYRQIRPPHRTQARPASPPIKERPARKLKAETQTAVATTLIAKYPAYAEYVLAHLPEPQRADFLMRCQTAHSFGHPIRWPRPSEVFPGLHTGLNDRLIREQHDQDIPLLEAMAKVPAEEQREFYERYLNNPEQAKLWASLPRWKRPLVEKDRQSELIWKLFTIIRLEREYWAGRCSCGAERMSGGVHNQGYRLIGQAGLLDSITDTQRLASVLSMYGSMLMKGSDLGNVTEPPWKNGR